MAKTETSLKFEENRTKGKTMKVFCLECNHTNKHRVVTSLDGKGEEWCPSEGWGVGWTDGYQVIQCEGCETVSFRHLHWFSEDHHPEYGQDGYLERLYPKRHANSLKGRNLFNVPFGLRRLYVEVIECYNNDSLILCAAGLRAIVDGLCADQGVVNGPVKVFSKDGSSSSDKRKNTLEGKIAGMQEKGLLTATSAKALHEHRFLGNDALHDLARPDQDDLKLAIEIVEHTLDQLYEIPRKALSLNRSIAKRKAQAAAKKVASKAPKKPS